MISCQLNFISSYEYIILSKNKYAYVVSISTLKEGRGGGSKSATPPTLIVNFANYPLNFLILR